MTIKDDKLTQSLEKYLLAIFEIVSKTKACRVRDVSNYLKIGGPATSDAIKILAKKGYIDYVPYGVITITQKGIKKSQEKINRHSIISMFLSDVLKIEPKKADISATLMEYSLDDEVLDKFVKFLTFQESCSCKAPKWKKSFEYYAINSKMQFKCQECMKSPESCAGCGCGEGCHQNNTEN